MSIDKLTLLAAEALEIAAKATPSSEQTLRVTVDEFGDDATDVEWRSPSEKYVIAKFDREQDADLYITACTALPALAAAVVELGPFVAHKPFCRSTRIYYSPPEEPRHGDCDCGLSAALSRLGEAK